MKVFLSLFSLAALLTGTSAFAFSVSPAEYVQQDQTKVMGFLQSQGRGQAEVTFKSFDGPDSMFVANVSPQCQWTLSVVHTPIVNGIGNGMVQRRVERVSETGHCIEPLDSGLSTEQGLAPSAEQDMGSTESY